GVDGQLVELLAGEAVERGDEVGGDALRHEVGGKGRLRVHGPGAAVGGHGHAGHGLDAAGEDELVHAGADLGAGQVDGGQSGGAEAVDLHAGGAVRQARGQGGGAGDVGALVADRGDAADDHVIDAVFVEAGVAGAEFADEADEQGEGADDGERADRR